MMAQPVARYLTRFGAGEADDVVGAQDASSFITPLEPQPALNIEALVEAARAEGFAKGQADAKAAEEARLVQERQTFAERLEVARQTWTGEQAERLASMIGAGMDALEARIAGSAAEVLRPFIATALRERALTELAGALATLIRDKDHPALRISGPPDLVGALGAMLGERTGVELCPDDAAADVSILVEQTLIESRMAAWAARLRDGMETAHGG